MVTDWTQYKPPTIDWSKYQRPTIDWSKFYGKETQPQESTFQKWTGINPSTYVQESVEQVKQGPINWVKNAIGSIYNTFTNAFKNAWKENKDLITTAMDKNIPSYGAQRWKELAEAIGADVGVVFSPITAIFSAAEQIPVLKQANDILIGVPMTATGEIGKIATDKFVDVLPISQESKEIIRPAFDQLGSTFAQLTLGAKVVGRIMEGKKIDAKAVEEDVNLAKQYEQISKKVIEQNHPEVIKAVKEIKPVEKAIPKELEPLAEEARKYKSAEEFADKIFRKDLDEIYEAQKEIISELKDNGYKIQSLPTGYITLHHGTTEENAQKILKEGKFDEMSFFSHAKSHAAFGSEGAKKYGKTILSIKVDPRDVFFNSGTGEFEAEEGLVRGIDGVWRSPKRYKGEKVLFQGKTYEELNDFYNLATKGIKEVKPVSEVKPLTPEVAISKAGADLLREATERDIKLKSQELPTHEVVRLAEMDRKANELLIQNPKLAEDIALGKREAPEGYLKSSIYEAVERKAILDINTDLIERLKNSPVATKQGQELRGFKGYDELNPVDRIKEIEAVRGKGREGQTKRISERLKEETSKKNLDKKTLLKKLSDYIDEIPTC